MIGFLARRYGYGLTQRLGNYPTSDFGEGGNCRRVWLHASSVGEVQAARVLIGEFSARHPEIHCILTTMTEHGHRVALKQFTDKVSCYLAPLDMAPAVRRALQAIRPDLYVCLETELWPAMLTEARRAGIRMVLLNGRMSERSYRRYRRIHCLIEPLLDGFEAFGVIRQADADRFAGLGVSREQIQVTGNIKYDLQAGDADSVRGQYRTALGLEGKKVFICGSTHTGEEELLISVYRRLADQSDSEFIWIVAPRHLERLAQVKSLFNSHGIGFDLYTGIMQGNRLHGVILVDCMGELANLYAAGDFIFCGGSLVDRGGHNIMEAARWGRPVYFGPSMKDFRDAVELLEPAGAGFQVMDAGELTEIILAHMHDAAEYNKACRAALSVAASQHGSAKRQVDMVERLLGLNKFLDTVQ
ncbi:MAG: hypothetical protein GQ559_12420 [Desulfobulbaceae bacterium]|nr:hypothetical protein [Desulfobulbaceae bacterium]